MTSTFYPNATFINQGRDYNYFQKIAVDWTSFGAGSSDGYGPDAIITFSTQTVMFVNLTASGTSDSVVEYSFNGNVLHGELNPTNSTIALTFENRTISQIWFRIQSGSSGPITVSVQAWGIR
jgi:hypothetical protein